MTFDKLNKISFLTDTLIHVTIHAVLYQLQIKWLYTLDLLNKFFKYNIILEMYLII